MIPLRKLTVLVAAGLVAFAPAACAHKGGGTGSGPVVPSVSTSAGPVISVVPSASVAGPPSTAAPARATPTAGRVVSARVAYAWHWPNDTGEAVVRHEYAVPPVPELIGIGAASHPASGGERGYDRISFTFTTAMPSYSFAFVSRLVGDGSGQTVPIQGPDVLRVTFRQAQAHTADGSGSSIATQPRRPLHLTTMTDYAQAGDFEGVVTYGVGTARPVLHSNPQTPVRAYEVVRALADGTLRYTVAIDIAVR